MIKIIYKTLSITLCSLFYLLAINSNSYANTIITPEPSIFNNISIISTGKVKEIIARSLAEQKIGDKVSIKIKGYEKGVRLDEKHESFNLKIKNLSINKKIRRFNLIADFQSGSFSQSKNISGSYEQIISIPVLQSKIPHNTIITNHDIEFIDIKKSRVKHDTVKDAQFLIGKTLKRSMQKMRPIRRRDIVKQQIVSRNKVVNLRYKTPFITLQTMGIAMDNGAKGDIIRVRNNESNKIIQAEIKSANLVIVSPEKL